MSKLLRGISVGNSFYPDVAYADGETMHDAIVSYKQYERLGKLVWGGRKIKDGKLYPTLAGKCY